MGGEGQNQHVLVINDEPAVLDLYRDLLTDEGYRVTLWTYPTSDSMEVARLAPDLVLLDLLVGHEDLGWQFLRRLKMDPATAAIPILICTAAVTLLAEIGDDLRRWDCGVVTKPFDIDVLLGAVHACLHPHTNGATERAG